MSELKPYPKYKDSGVEWIGEIPENWDKVALSRIITVSSGKSVSTNKIHRKPTSEFIYPVIGGNGLMGYTDSVNIQNSTISIGRVGALCGNVHLINYKSWITDNSLYITNYNKNQVDLEYLTNVLRMVNLNEYSTSTAQPLITGETVKRREIPFPKLELQQQISLYVKSKISEIDSLIADKEKLIELLEEKRQAVITETVTKGLDPTVKMKDSGVEWIGDIPEHWEITRLKRCLVVKNGKEIYDGDIKGEAKYKVYGSGGAFKTSNYYLFDGVSVLFGRKGTIGKPLLVDGKFWAVDTMYYTEMKNNTIPSYIFYLLEGFPWSSIATKTALPSIVGSDVENSLVVMPDSKEQTGIVEYIDEQSTKIKETINIIIDQISKLKEYRESLIYEAVTGKIDLRDYKSEME